MLGFVPADREDVMVVYWPVRDRRKDLCLAAAERKHLERSQFLNSATPTLNNRSTSSPCTEPVIDLLVREQRSESKRGGP